MKNKPMLILFLCCGIGFAQQTKNGETALSVLKNKDTTRTISALSFVNFAGYRFKNLYFPLSNKYAIYGVYTGKIPLGVADQFIEIKRNLILGFEVMKRAQERKSLGVVGKILDYTNAAAVLGLAAYHFSKYGWNAAKLKKESD